MWFSPRGHSAAAQDVADNMGLTGWKSKMRSSSAQQELLDKYPEVLICDHLQVQRRQRRHRLGCAHPSPQMSHPHPAKGHRGPPVYQAQAEAPHRHRVWSGASGDMCGPAAA